MHIKNIFSQAIISVGQIQCHHILNCDLQHQTSTLSITLWPILKGVIGFIYHYLQITYRLLGPLDFSFFVSLQQVIAVCFSIVTCLACFYLVVNCPGPVQNFLLVFLLSMTMKMNNLFFKCQANAGCTILGRSKHFRMEPPMHNGEFSVVTWN